jgi:hypothetical protein
MSDYNNEVAEETKKTTFNVPRMKVVVLVLCLTILLEVILNARFAYGVVHNVRVGREEQRHINATTLLPLAVPLHQGNTTTNDNQTLSEIVIDDKNNTSKNQTLSQATVNATRVASKRTDKLKDRAVFDLNDTYWY